MSGFWDDYSSSIVLRSRWNRRLVGSSSSTRRIWQSIKYTFVIISILGLASCSIYALMLGKALGIAFESGMVDDKGWKFVEVGSLLFAALITVYWNIDSRFGRLWTYAATTFNEAAQVERYHTRRYLLACLALDLIDMGLWSHETFGEFFKREVGLSIEWLESVDIGKSLSLCAQIESGRAKKDEVVSVIYGHVQFLRKIDENDLRICGGPSSSETAFK